MKNLRVRQRKTKNGYVWEYRFEIGSIDGSRKEKSKSGFLKKSDAEKAGKEAYNAYFGLTEKSFVEKNITFKDFVENVWFPVQSSTMHWKESTKINYKKRITRFVYPSIGDMYINNIKSIQLQNMLNNLYDSGISHNTISDLHSLLFSIFKFANGNNYVSLSPMTTVITPKIKEGEKEKRVKQKRDIIPNDVIQSILKKFNEQTIYYLPIFLSLKTGMRLGEVFGLCWEDIDFEKNIINITRQMNTQAANLEVSNPKYNSKRTVPMSEDLKEVLLKKKKRQEYYSSDLGPYYKHTYISKKDNNDYHNTFSIDYFVGEEELHFVNVYDDGSIVKPKSITYLSRVIHGYNSKNEKLEKDEEHYYIYEDFNFHSLRHTFASKLYESGVGEFVISKLLGHSSSRESIVSKITFQYLHLTDEDYEKVRKIIEKF